MLFIILSTTKWQSLCTLDAARTNASVRCGVSKFGPVYFCIIASDGERVYVEHEKKILDKLQSKLRSLKGKTRLNFVVCLAATPVVAEPEENQVVVGRLVTTIDNRKTE